MAIPFPQNPANLATGATTTMHRGQLAFVETIATFLQYKSGTAEENQDNQEAALAILSTLAVSHPDGISLLGSSSSLIQRLIVKNSADAALIYESPVMLQSPVTFKRYVGR